MPIFQALAFSTATRRPPAPQRRWSSEEDALLKKGIAQFGENWSKISSLYLPDRNRMMCSQRWRRVLSPAVKLGPWTPEVSHPPHPHPAAAAPSPLTPLSALAQEDARLTHLVGEYGPNKWAKIAEQIKGRSIDSCMRRWSDHLCPDLLQGPWSADEDALLLQKHADHPKQWAAIKQHLPGRSPIAISRRYKSLTHRSTPCHWTAEDDALLIEMVSTFGTRNWAGIADALNKTGTQCTSRWSALVKRGQTKSAWSTEDDDLLANAVQEHGQHWTTVAAAVPGKTGMECKVRWENEVSKRNSNSIGWTAEEDAELKRLRSTKKPWAEILHTFPGRDVEDIKQRCADMGKPVVVKWSAAEVAALETAILAFKGKLINWKTVATAVPGRTAKQCQRKRESDKKAKSVRALKASPPSAEAL